MSATTKRPIPTFKTDEEAERFVDTADLTEYDLAGEFVTFEQPHVDRTVSLSLPEELMKEVERQAERAGVPYKRFIRMAIERAVRSPKPPV